jgi:hypothetical protein
VRTCQNKSVVLASKRCPLHCRVSFNGTLVNGGSTLKLTMMLADMQFRDECCVQRAPLLDSASLPVVWPGSKLVN